MLLLPIALFGYLTDQVICLRKRCTPDPLPTRVNSSEVVISGTCEKVVNSHDSSTCQIMHVWRVVKGSELLNNIAGKTTSQSEYGDEMTLPVYGFDSQMICESRIRQQETKIIFAKLSGDYRRLVISHSLLHITERNLDAVEFMARAEAHHDPCSGINCKYGAACHDGQCLCNHVDCRYTELSPVCGSDGVVYVNACHLIKHGCRYQTPISVQYRGLCNVMQEKRCIDNIACNGIGEICEQYVCKCRVCDHTELSAVCGTDGNTYKSKCHLNRRVCLQKLNNVKVKYDGICKVCQPVYWSGEPTNNARYCSPACLKCQPLDEQLLCDSNSTITYLNRCIIECSNVGRSPSIQQGSCLSVFKTRYGQQCPECVHKECTYYGTERKCHCSICPDVDEPVCGTDGNTYNSKCVLDRTNCEFPDSNLKIAHNGECRDTEIKCEPECKFGAICLDNKCSCNFACKDLVHHVCDGNGVKYTNMCYLLKEQCNQQRPLKVSGNMNCIACTEDDLSMCPIYALQCFNGQCVCPNCEREYDSFNVCGSDGITYENRCSLREHACLNNMEVFEIPCASSSTEIDEEGSGDALCLFGGERAYTDDEEHTMCECNWHCPTILNDMSITKCAFYRDAMCKRQQNLQSQLPYFPPCEGPNVLDPMISPNIQGCLCKPRYTGVLCDSCQTQWFMLNGFCTFCNCSSRGSVNMSCGNDGKCICKPGYTGDKCHESVALENKLSCNDYNDRMKTVCASDGRFYQSVCAIEQVNMHEEFTPTEVEDRMCMYSTYYTTMGPSALLVWPTMSPKTFPTQTTKSIYYGWEKDIEQSGEMEDDCDDEDCNDSGSGEYGTSIPKTIDPGEYQLTKTTQGPYPKKSAEYEVRFLDLNHKGREQLIDAVTDDVTMIFKKMIPEIQTIEVFNPRVVDHDGKKCISSRLIVKPPQPAGKLIDAYNTYFELDEAIAQKLEIVQTMWYGGNSLSRYEFATNSHKTYQLGLRLRFKTTGSNGLIIWIGPSKENLTGVRSTRNPSLTVFVKSNKLELTLGRDTITKNTEINDNYWHVIDIQFNRGSISFKLDKGFDDVRYSELNELCIAEVYLGGVPKNLELDILPPLAVHKGFTGCMETVEVAINKSNQHIKAELKSENNISSCDRSTTCQANPNPCRRTDCEELPNGHSFCKEPTENNKKHSDMAFNSYSYVVLPTKRMSKLEIRFLPIVTGQKNVALFHISDKLIVSIKRGYIDIEAAKDGFFTQIHKSTLPLANKQTTLLEFTFSRNTVQISYCQNECQNKETTNVDLSFQFSNQNIIIGKLHESIYPKLTLIQRSLAGFDSVVHIVKVDGIELNLWKAASLLRLVVKSDTSYTEPELISPYSVTEENTDQWYMFDKPNTYLNQINDQVKHLHDLTIKLHYKTTSTSGTIIYMSNNQGTEKLHIFMKDGYLFIKVIIDGKEQELESLYNQSDGNTHKMELEIRNDLFEQNKVIKMILGDNQDILYDNLWTTEPFKTNGLLYVGGKPKDHRGDVDAFNGCICCILIDSKQLLIKRHAREYNSKECN